MPYRPFPIVDFKTAKFIGKEPWLSPLDAFSTLENMNVNKGVLEKRLGFSELAQMTHGTTPQIATAITGIHEYIKDGMPSLLIMDTTRCNLYDSVDSSMTDISSDLTTPANIFSGSASDFFSFINWQGVGYMTNNKDQIHQWQGRNNAVVPFNIQISSDTKANHVNTCRFLFIKDDRILLLDTTEFGDWKPNRLRYSPVLSTDFKAAGAGNVDAPTQLRVVAAGFVENDIAVYMQGGTKGQLWLIKSTANADIPYRWVKKTETELVRSPYSGIEVTINGRNGLLAVGNDNIIFYDGFQVRPIDLPNIRDILDEFKDSFIRNIFAYNQKEQRHLLITFADSASSNINRILDYNQIENNWTKHKSAQSFFVNTIGGFNEQKVPAFIDLDDVITFDPDEVQNMTVDSRAVLGSPKPIALIGCRNSRVYKWGDGNFDGTNDANGVIAIDARTIEMNPFVKDGRKVDLEKIEFYMDNDSNASFTASLFKDTSTSAYKTKVISADLSNDKGFATIFADGEIGKFHKLKISHSERNNRPRIHEIVPYMQPAGRLTA